MSYTFKFKLTLVSKLNDIFFLLSFSTSKSSHQIRNENQANWSNLDEQKHEINFSVNTNSLMACSKLDSFSFVCTLFIFENDIANDDTNPFVSAICKYTYIFHSNFSIYFNVKLDQLLIEFFEMIACDFFSLCVYCFALINVPTGWCSELRVRYSQTENVLFFCHSVRMKTILWMLGVWIGGIYAPIRKINF